MAKFIILCLLWALSVQAGVLPATTETEAGLPMGVHTEYHNSETGEKFQLLVAGYSGTPKVMQPNPNFTPTAHFKPTGNSTALEERDTCQLVRDCAGKCADSVSLFAQAKAAATLIKCAEIANTVSEYLSENNYEKAKDIVANGVVSVSITLALAVPLYYMNAKLSSGGSSSSSDACGEHDPSTYTGNAATATYEFCLAIQSQQQSEITTRYIASDSKSLTSTQTSGREGLAKFFISQQTNTFASICSDFGVTWRKLFHL